MDTRFGGRGKVRRLSRFQYFPSRTAEVGEQDRLMEQTRSHTQDWQERKEIAGARRPQNEHRIYEFRRFQRFPVMLFVHEQATRLTTQAMYHCARYSTILATHALGSSATFSWPHWTQTKTVSTHWYLQHRKPTRGRLRRRALTPGLVVT